MKLILTLLAAAAAILALRVKSSRHKFLAAAVAVGLAVFLLIQAWFHLPESSVASPDLPFKGRPGYAGSDTCIDCHASEHESWHKSYHRSMTQIASPESVVAPFDDVVLHARTRSFYLTREGDAFLVDMPDPEWEQDALAKGQDLSKVQPPRKRTRVVMTTGSHIMQTYWIPTEQGNKLRQLPWVYDISEKRWMPNIDSFICPPSDDAEVLATRLSIHWNKSCIRCHAVAGRTTGTPDYWQTSVAELGISCEACHGPGEAHVTFHRQEEPGAEPKAMINPADCDSKVAAQICGQCHSDSDHNQSDGDYHPGDDLLATHRMYNLQTTRNPNSYWRDGTMRVGGREFTAMVESACYLRGELSCLSCHSLHQSDPDDQLATKMDTNEACLQCHSTYRDRIEEHTHHASESVGSHCYNCHMPYTSYALLKSIRSHRIDSPSVRTSLKYGRPNACNNCHLDRTLSWTADHMQQWYGIDSGKLDEDAETYPASLIWLLKGDAVQRAVTADAFRWDAAKQASGDHWQAPFLAYLLKDPYSAVRAVAYKSLRELPGYGRLKYDFTAEKASRDRVFAQAIQIWSEQRPGKPLPSGLRSLQNDQGELNSRRVEGLIKQRDDTPLLLSE